MPERRESVVLDFDVDLEDSITSIESLTKANKELREERKKLNLDTEAGKKRAQEINALLDKNTEIIKDNVSALEKQRLNIGNYKSALDNIIPGLSGFIDKGAEATKTVQGLTLAQKLLLGPLGLLILAFTAIVKWLTGSEEGMDKLAIITAKVSAVVGVVTDRLIQLGGALVQFLSGDFSGGIEGIKNSFTGMGDEMQREIDLATELAERLDILDDLNIALRVRLAEQENVIKNLIIQSRNRFLSEEERMKLLIQASALEKQLTGERLALRLAEINAIASEIQMRNSEKQAAQEAGETTIEFAKRIVGDTRILFSEREKIAEQLEKYNTLLDNQANIQEKIKTQQDDLTEKLREQAREAAALARANERAANQLNAGTDDPLVRAFETRAKVITDINDRMNDEMDKRNEKAYLDEVRRRKDGLAYVEQVERSKLQIISGAVDAAAQFFEEDSATHKALASAQALINTYLAATAALASGSKINPVFGILSAAAAIANGLAAVAQINGVQFAEGGWTGPGGKYDVAGVVHKDEYVVPKRVKNLPQAQPHIAAIEQMRLRGYADGGLVTNSIASPVNSQLELLNIVKNLPPQVLDVREVTKKQKRIDVREQFSKR